MKKSIFVLIAVLLLTTILVACGGTPAPSPSPSPAPSPTASPKPSPSPTASPSPSPTASPKPTATQKQQWRFYTTGEGTFAYTVSVGMARVANKYNTDVELIILTGKASTQTHALYEQNETDSAYSSAQALLQAWTNTGIFQKDPVKYKPYQSAYLYTADQFFLIPADRNDMKTLADLQGKKLYPHFKGSGAWDSFAQALQALGYWDKITIRDMANTEATDALLTKAIDAIGAFSIGQNTLNPWLTDMDARAKIKVLEPTAAEKEKIGKIPGVSILPPVA
ncbi:MAG: TAXI family TRAP transporter solute-binding subunit, partial [Dehalococcoidales bacterium]|nr:TAXI family TRAP transporter solute-binding subunit [Dehalococcoidales bacterium]